MNYVKLGLKKKKDQYFSAFNLVDGMLFLLAEETFNNLMNTVVKLNLKYFSQN